MLRLLAVLGVGGLVHLLASDSAKVFGYDTNSWLVSSAESASDLPIRI
jgi:hypothetical protein